MKKKSKVKKRNEQKVSDLKECYEMKNTKQNKNVFLPEVICTVKKSERLPVVGKDRGDGLIIFCDGDEPLDRIRRTGTKQEVILAVALRRAQEIAINYARKYAPEILNQIEYKITAPVLGLPQGVK